MCVLVPVVMLIHPPARPACRAHHGADQDGTQRHHGWGRKVCRLCPAVGTAGKCPDGVYITIPCAELA